MMQEWKREICKYTGIIYWKAHSYPEIYAGGCIGRLLGGWAVNDEQAMYNVVTQEAAARILALHEA